MQEDDNYIPSPQNLEVSYDIISDAKQKMYEARDADAVRVAEAELRQIREAACVSIENDGKHLHVVNLDGQVIKVVTTMDEFDAYMAC